MNDYLKGIDFGKAMSDSKDKNRFTNKYYQNSLDSNFVARNFDELNVNSKKPNLSRNGHRQRMRQSYLNGSMENMPDHNLLELFLSIIIPQKDVKELAYALINKFGSLEGVLNADAQQLMTVNGIGEAAAVGIKMVVELNKRVMKNKNQNVLDLNCCEEAVNYCKNILCYEKVEKLIMITINNDGSIINTHTIGTGNANSSSANQRQILENAIIDHASGAIFAHNHPSGSSKPSDADVNFSMTIGTSLSDIGINFVDHIIIGNDEPFSLRMSTSAL
ncbi:MAG: DNA repair protein RadC [Eubacteriales bacterium]|nr:DNA repair protein RadC [Eubacteriales bacterium]